MLHELRILHYAVIESLAVEFGPGLNLLSGETGSGKSILVDSLGLALGGRASPEVIRSGEERAVVTALFSAEGEPGWGAWRREYGVAGSGAELILRREIQAEGRSRMLVNDQPVTLAAMRALAPCLVEMHGQNEHVALFAPEAQLDLLDQFAGADAALAEVRAAYARRRALEQELDSLSQNEQERLHSLDLLTFQARELDEARLSPGEDARLEDERLVLTNLEKIRALAHAAFHGLYEDEGAAIARVTAAARQLEELGRYGVAGAGAYLEPLAAARATLEDAAAFLRDYLGKLEANPHRLEEIEDRLALLARLKRKYGDTVEKMLDYAQETRRRLAALEHADERREVVRRELEGAAEGYFQAAGLLSKMRREAAERLLRLTRSELEALGMAKTRLEAHFERVPDGKGGPAGIDVFQLLISPNPGEELRPMERIASGGELSRLMLALKTVVGQARTQRLATEGGTRAPAGTFVFDEVDAGIGGRVAELVGQRLQRLARSTQVLCVTHLAQIACFADRHLYVEKYTRAGRTAVTVTPLAEERERSEELARMLSGSRITDAVREHAAAMLRQARRRP